MLVHTNRHIFLIIVLLFIISCTLTAVINVENQGQMICIPNATFHIDCNSCRCSPTGMSIDCTDWSCATLKIPHDLLLNVTLPCSAGEIFLYNRHKCLCGVTGRWATCSSAQHELALNLRPTSGSIISFAESIVKCTPGYVFKRDSCGTCICSEIGHAVCLGIDCGRLEADCNRPMDLSEKSCVPYSRFSVDCNQCTCSSDGYSLSCDVYPCLGVEMRDDQLLNITFHCAPGSSFLYNAYECLCSASGRRALCSLAGYDRSVEFRAANKKIFSIAESRELCTPGMTFKDKCNICICGEDEQAACTRIDCELASYGSEDSSYRIIPKHEVWIHGKKSARFCRKHSASMYCRYFRSF